MYVETSLPNSILWCLQFKMFSVSEAIILVMFTISEARFDLFPEIFMWPQLLLCLLGSGSDCVTVVTENSHITELVICLLFMSFLEALMYFTFKPFGIP